MAGEQPSKHVRIVAGDVLELRADVVADEETQLHPIHSGAQSVVGDEDGLVLGVVLEGGHALLPADA